MAIRDDVDTPLTLQKRGRFIEIRVNLQKDSQRYKFANIFFYSTTGINAGVGVYIGINFSSIFPLICKITRCVLSLVVYAGIPKCEINLMSRLNLIAHNLYVLERQNQTGISICVCVCTHACALHASIEVANRL